VNTILNLIREHWRVRKSGHGLVLYAYPLTRNGNYVESNVDIIFDGKLISGGYSSDKKDFRLCTIILENGKQ